MIEDRDLSLTAPGENEWIDAPAGALDRLWKLAYEKAERLGKPDEAYFIFGYDVAARYHPRCGRPR